MKKISKTELSKDLAKVYEELKKLPQSDIKGTIEYKVVFELENINLKYGIKFLD